MLVGAGASGKMNSQLLGPRDPNRLPPNAKFVKENAGRMISLSRARIQQKPSNSLQNSRIDGRP